MNERKAAHVSSSTNSKTLSQNCVTVGPVKTLDHTLNISASPPNYSSHVNSTCDPSSSINKAHSNEASPDTNTMVFSFGDTTPAKSIIQDSFNQSKETSSTGLTNGKNTEVVDGTVQTSTQRQDSASSPSEGRMAATPRSSIPLPRNPTKAMGAFHPPSSSPSEENLEPKALNVETVTSVPKRQECAKEQPASAQSKKSTDSTSGIAHSSLGATTTPITNQNGISVLSPPGSISTSSPPTPTPPTQTRRTSGLMGPRVVVNKPGIKMYKGGNASSLTSSQSSLGKTNGNERETQNNGKDVSVISTPMITQNSAVSSPSTPLATVSPILPTPVTSSVAASPKPASNIRPPSVTVEGFPSSRNRLSRSSIPTCNSSGTRNARHDSSNGSSTPRSIPTPTTGIRMPSRLPRQTAAK
nr:hypothetical transcript [Hymenolepis microstoma]